MIYYAFHCRLQLLSRQKLCCTQGQQEAGSPRHALALQSSDGCSPLELPDQRPHSVRGLFGFSQNSTCDFFFLMWNQNIFQEKALRKSEGKKKCSEDIGNMVCKALLHQKYIPLTAGPQFFYLQVTNGISCATEITGEEEADPECFQRYFSYHWQADELNLVPAARRGSGKALAVPRAASQHPTRLFKGKKCLCPFVSGIRMSGRGAGAEGSSGSLLPPAAAKPDPLLQQALLSRRLSALSAAGGAEHFPT